MTLLFFKTVTLNDYIHTSCGTFSRLLQDDKRHSYGKINRCRCGLSPQLDFVDEKYQLLWILFMRLGLRAKRQVQSTSDTDSFVSSPSYLRVQCGEIENDSSEMHHNSQDESKVPDGWRRNHLITAKNLLHTSQMTPVNWKLSRICSYVNDFRTVTKLFCKVLPLNMNVQTPSKYHLPPLPTLGSHVELLDRHLTK